jgi:CTD kinase subunit alpha
MQYKSLDQLYQIIDQIGAGGYGKVYKAKKIANRTEDIREASSIEDSNKEQLDLKSANSTQSIPKISISSTPSNENLVALKMIRVETEHEGFPLTAVREVQLLRSLCSEFVVSLLDIVTSSTSVYLVFEYLPWDLAGLLLHPSTATITASQIKCLMKQLLQCISYLHSRGVLHRDIKSANFLLSSNGSVKIADFGLAKQLVSDKNACLTNRVVTIWYRPPEVLLGSTSYGPEVDIWGIGCIFGELFLKKPPFVGGTCEVSQLECIFETFGPLEEDLVRNVYSQLPYADLIKFIVQKEDMRNDKPVVAQTLEAYKKTMSSEAWNLFTSLVELDPKRRITAQDALRHPYFTQEAPLECPKEELATLLEGEWHEFETKNLRRKRWSSEVKI